jgi:hypothetical protein
MALELQDETGKPGAGSLSELRVAVRHGYSQAQSRLLDELRDLLVVQICLGDLRAPETRTKAMNAINTFAAQGRSMGRSRLPAKPSPVSRLFVAILEARAEIRLRFHAIRTLRYAGLASV